MKKAYSYEDITRTDFELLKNAAFLSDGYFLCFGKHYNKLYSLSLINEDFQVTRLGKKYVRYVLQRNQ